MRDAWPTIEQTYTDEFGEIDRDVFATALQIWPQARPLALGILRDEQAGYTLLFKACAQVTRKRADNSAAIENLPAYLFRTWKRLLLYELEKENGHRRREAEMAESLPQASDSDADNLDRKILIQQILKRTDEQTRRIFWYLCLGFTFPEIGEKLGRNPDVLRATYNQQIRKLEKQLAPEE
jgi:DNA-directed RNA polymerase specialized sigma24 family protein